MHAGRQAGGSFRVGAGNIKMENRSKEKQDRSKTEVRQKQKKSKKGTKM